MLVLHYYFAVDRSRVPAQRHAESKHHLAVLSGPVVAVTGKRAALAVIDYDQRPVAVIFDLVFPFLALWRGVHQCRQKRGDE